jgi:signal transduction histidine kinase
VFARARLQITVAYAVVLVLTIGALGAAAYAVVRHQLDDEINRSLATALDQIEALPAGQPADESGERPDEDSSHDADDDEDDDGRDGEGGGIVFSISPDVFFVTTDADGTVLTNPRRVDLGAVSFADLIAGSQAGDTRRDVSSEHGRFRIITTETTGSETAFLHVGRSLEARDRQLRTLVLVFGAGGGAALALSAGAGYWLAGCTLRPIRESLETQRRFVSDASHELRTPIAVVKANNELLLRHPDQTVEANLDQVEAIAVESDHMARLVSDLLTLARADEGRAELTPERFDLAALAAEVARDMEPLADSRGLTLRTRFSPANIRGDSQRLRQLATILVDNALKYTPAGGTVSVSCAPAGRNVEMSVADTGPGIAAAEHARVFDRFYRVDKSRSRAEGGSGLGLAIARWIAEAHGGRITLQSRPGAGSTFTLRIPASD